MKTLHYLVANNLSLLHDEIQAAIPLLAPVRDADGLGTPVMTVKGDDEHVWLTVPDDADEATIAAVVQAHDATKFQPDLRRDRLARIAELADEVIDPSLKELVRLMAAEMNI